MPATGLGIFHMQSKLISWQLGDAVVIIPILLTGKKGSESLIKLPKVTHPTFRAKI